MQCMISIHFHSCLLCSLPCGLLYSSAASLFTSCIHVFQCIFEALIYALRSNLNASVLLYDLSLKLAFDLFLSHTTADQGYQSASTKVDCERV
ncbi:hypothetical protein SORBI_3010G143100 [Sorghum bicolor]|uniref:Secreted protein n=1 Tax=Sorghum bicolor TaxID=4558 RepID=A0A194YKA2_SORBI|nr:hypothetical protein SORBI_3010G143100 [Sorghum bicolor]